MKELKVATLMLLMLMWKTEVDSTTSDCYFLTYEFTEEVGSLYGCVNKNPNDLVGDSVIIDNVTGEHEPDKNDNDVKFFFVQSADNLTKIPSGFDITLPELLFVSFYNCGLTELTRSDIEQFENMKYLNLNYNPIKVLYEGTFDANPSLEKISFSDNQIEHVDPSTFSDLGYLNALDLFGNSDCSYLYFAKTRAEVEIMVGQIEDGICLSSDYSTFDNLKQINLKLQNDIANLEQQLYECESKGKMCGMQKNLCNCEASIANFTLIIGNLTRSQENCQTKLNQTIVEVENYFNQINTTSTSLKQKIEECYDEKRLITAEKNQLQTSLNQILERIGPQNCEITTPST